MHSARVLLRALPFERLPVTTTNAPSVADVLDLRKIAPRERHTTIFSRFDALQQGNALELINDHNPQPLHYQFDDRAYGQFEWSTLEAGPAVWRVQITRIGNNASVPEGDSCCSGGACCG